jgi:hypothetical protein
MGGVSSSSLLISGEKLLSLLAEVKSDLSGLNSRIDIILIDVQETRRSLTDFQKACHLTHEGVQNAFKEIDAKFSFQNGERAGREAMFRWAQAKVGMIVGIIGVLAMLLQYYAMK